MDMTILIDLTTDLMIMIHKDPGVETVEQSSKTTGSKEFTKRQKATIQINKEY